MGDHFGAWMILGRFGFMPLFFLSAALGCIGVVSLSSALPVRGFAWLGRVSLHLYLINAVVVDFVLPRLAQRRIPDFGVFHYLALFVFTLVAHLAVLLVARKPIEWLRAVCASWAKRLVKNAPRHEPQSALP